SRRKQILEDDDDDDITESTLRGGSDDQMAAEKSLEEMTKEELDALPAETFFDMLGYNDKSDDNLDDMESKRDFLNAVENFLRSKAEALMRRQQSNKSRKYLSGITRKALQTFMDLCLQKYERSRVQPGHA